MTTREEGLFLEEYRSVGALTGELGLMRLDTLGYMRLYVNSDRPYVCIHSEAEFVGPLGDVGSGRALWRRAAEGRASSGLFLKTSLVRGKDGNFADSKMAWYSSIAHAGGTDISIARPATLEELHNDIRDKSGRFPGLYRGSRDGRYSLDEIPAPPKQGVAFYVGGAVEDYLADTVPDTVGLVNALRSMGFSANGEGRLFKKASGAMEMEFRRLYVSAVELANAERVIELRKPEGMLRRTSVPREGIDERRESISMKLQELNKAGILRFVKEVEMLPDGMSGGKNAVNVERFIRGLESRVTSPGPTRQRTRS